MRRRTILSAIALAPVAACTTGTPTLAQLVTDAQSIAAALQAEAPIVLPLVADAAVSAKISGYIADVQSVASKLSAALTATAASPLVQQIIGDVQAVAPIVLAIAGLPPGTVAAINAALALLPVLAAQVGLTSATLKAPVYAPAEARLILLGAASK